MHSLVKWKDSWVESSAIHPVNDTQTEHDGLNTLAAAAEGIFIHSFNDIHSLIQTVIIAKHIPLQYRY
jgi:hypothetical protein